MTPVRTREEDATAIAVRENKAPPRTIMRAMNAVLPSVLRSPLHAAVSKNILLLSFPGRKSGRRYTTPMSYVQEGQTVFMSTEAPWWKNLSQEDGTKTPVSLWLRGRESGGSAEAVTDAEGVKEGLRAILRQYPGYSRFVGVEMDERGRPNEETMDRAASRGRVLIRVRVLDEVPTAGSLVVSRGLLRRLLDRFVGAVLRSPLHGLAGFDRFGMLMTFTGRKSGRRYTLPLAYTREGDTVTTFALFTNTVWWKNLRGGVRVTLRLRGEDVAGTAEVEENPEMVADGLLAMAEKNPGQARRGYYAVPRDADGGVDREALLARAQTKVMVKVRLEQGTEPEAMGREFSPLMKRLMRAAVGAHAFVYRRTGGRISGRMGIAPVLLLTTPGRKTGKRRTMPLSYVADGDRFVVVGAMGGAPKDPAWVFNLRHDPRVTVQVGADENEMRAEVARGEERERLWGRINALTKGGFQEMQKKTRREFPVVVLSPERSARRAENS